MTGGGPGSPAAPRRSAFAAPQRDAFATPPRILFAVMSAQQSAATVMQLVDALDPHPVVVHHDFSRRRDFALAHPRASLVPDPRRTGWGTWGFAEAIFHTIRHALAHHDFDYLQLLSPTCLPIRPLDAFARHLAADPARIHADLMRVDDRDDVLMTFGYRTYAAGGTLRFRLLRRARAWYFGAQPRLVQACSLSQYERLPGSSAGSYSLRARIALALTRQAANGRLSAHPFGPGLRPMVGSTWFGAYRSVLEQLVRVARDPDALAFFEALDIVDETLFPTLLANAGVRIGPSNHAVSPFDEQGHPSWIGGDGLDALVATGRHFARKFPDEPDAPVRRRALALVRPAALAG